MRSRPRLLCERQGAWRLPHGRMLETVESSPSRTALFITHANPEDNEFVRWLGSKLVARGYEVWADILRLHGGADWARLLENALRERTVKQLVVCNNRALQKQGVRNEIQIGQDVSRKVGDGSFMIPLRLEPYDAPFLIAHAHYIRFDSGWARGLDELLATLEEEYRVPRGAVASPTRAWIDLQVLATPPIQRQPELLVSNWLPEVHLPPLLRFVEPPSGFPLEQFQDSTAHEWPAVPHAGGLLTFCDAAAGEAIGNGLVVAASQAKDRRDAVRDGWQSIGLSATDVRRAIAALVNRSADKYFAARGLRPHQASGPRPIWWIALKDAPFRQVRFRWKGYSGSRQLQGISKKRGLHWHYGMSVAYRGYPPSHLELRAHVVLTTNGIDVVPATKRSHRARVSLSKAWRNARWRDMQGAYLRHVSGGLDKIALPLSPTQFSVFGLPPMLMRAPVTVTRQGEVPGDDDDPDFDDGEFEPDDSWEEDVQE